MSRRPRPSAARRATAWLVLAAFVLAPPGLPAAFAAPEGEQVVHGQVDPFERTGDVTHIRTHSDRTIIRYTGFDIAPHETVNITQPGAGSRILNEVRSTSPTHLDGTLWSNGQVWVVNPIGVFVGDHAVIDVGGLVAAAGHVDHADFLAGVERFTDLRGAVEVAGGARIASADSVLLVGKSVANYGTITAPDGMIALVAGDRVQLARVDGRVIVNADPAAAPDPERFAVTQAGTADAGRGAVHLTAADGYSLAMNHTGITRAREIHAEGGEGGLVDVAGTLDARGEGPGDTGGTIHVLGDRIALGDATLDASGDAGGGDVRVGGDLQGKGTLRTARRTWVSAGAVLRADAGTSGDGGRVIVWADDATAFHGTLSARGGAEAGDGGFAEVSGRRSLVARGDVDLGAANGESGTLLYDPERIEILAGTADGSDVDVDGDVGEEFLRGDDGTAGTIGADDGSADTAFQIYESELESTDANIVLQAGRSVRTAGDVAFTDGVEILAGNDLTIAVTGTGEVEEIPEDDPDFERSFFGIDLRDPTDRENGNLVWRLSEGGRIELSTQATNDHVLAGDLSQILAHTLETRGVRADEAGAVTVQIEAGVVGSIDVGAIDARGLDRTDPQAKLEPGEDDPREVLPERGGNVFVIADLGDVTVGEVKTRGGNAVVGAEGDGGVGGSVDLRAVAGAIRVGDIDSSGGDAVLLLDTDEDGRPLPEVIGDRGGQAGAVFLVSGDPTTGAEPPPDGVELGVSVTGSILARGGDATGEAVAGDLGPTGLTRFGATGGAGNAILVQAGREQGAEPVSSVTLSPDTELDASGGDGSASGGPAGGIALRAGGNVVTGDAGGGARLVARGGDAGVGIDLGGPGTSGGSGGGGGDILLESIEGSVLLAAPAETGPALVTDGGTGFFEGANDLDGDGGAAGDVTLFSSGGNVAALGDISARGGDSDGQGDGGAGASIVRLEASDGDVVVSGIDASGGDGSGTLEADETLGVDPVGARGGNGGAIEIVGRTAALAIGEEPEGGVPFGVELRGDLDVLGGAGEATPDGDVEDPNENHGVAGRVALVTDGNVARPGDAVTVSARDVALEAGSIDPAGARLVLAAAADRGRASGEDTASVAVSGDAEVWLDQDHRFDRLSVAQGDVEGAVDVLRHDDGGGTSDGAAVVQGRVGTPEGDEEGRHVITRIDTTQEDDPHLTYRLVQSLADTGAGEPVVPDAFTLAVDTGAADVGAAGAKLANATADDVLLGRLVGQGAGPHVTTAGNLELLGTGVVGGAALAGAAGGAFSVAGVGADPVPGLELTVAGDVRLLASDLARIDVQQRRTSGDVDVETAAGDEVRIRGDAVDVGTIVETARVERVDTTASGTAFFYFLEDQSDGSRPRSEPALRIGPGEGRDYTGATAVVELGGEAGFASTGDVVLETATGGTGLAAADANGHTLALLADADLDGEGALRRSDAAEPGATDVLRAGPLALLAGEGVGSADDPLRVSGADAGADVTVAGSGGDGGFHLVNALGALRVGPVALRELQNDGVSGSSSFRGIDAGGDVGLRNEGGGPIVLAALQADAPAEGEDEPPEIQRLLGRPGLAVTGDADGSTLRVGFGGIGVAESGLQGAGDATLPHVVSGGGQTFGGDVVLENARAFVSPGVDPDTGEEIAVLNVLNEVRLEAGTDPDLAGDVVFEGDVDAGAGALASFTPDPDDPLQEELEGFEDRFVAASLEVDATGTTVFRGDVGTADVPEAGGDPDFASLVTRAARFEGRAGGVHVLDLARADFRGAVDAAGGDGLRIWTVAGADDEEGTRVTFRGDVGAGGALGTLDVDADRIVFDATQTSRADRVVAEGAIRLNGETPAAAVPERATIADTGGGLAFETGSTFTVGANEKLSAAGPLAIRAGGLVTVGDLSATSLRIDAPAILVQGRDPAPVELPDGSTRTDRGTDWVANEIVATATPTWDGVGTRPTFVLGDGGIALPSRLPFDVIRYQPSGREVAAASFVGVDGGILDLTGTGRRVTADPTQDVPRPLPDVAPALAVRFGTAEPARAPAVSEAEVLAYLDWCRSTVSAGACDPGAAQVALGMPTLGRTALGTERAQEIAAGTRELFGSPDARSRLAAAFAPVERAYHALAGPGVVDGASLYRLVADEPGLVEARARLDRLAAVLTQVDLLGMAPEDTERVQRRLAGEFAAAAAMRGLDAAAVLEATRTSPVGKLR